MCSFQWSGSVMPCRSTKTPTWALQTCVRFNNWCPTPVLISTPSLFPLHFLEFPPVHSSSTLSLGPTKSTSSPLFPLSFSTLCLTCFSCRAQYKEANASPFNWDNFFTPSCCSPISPFTSPLDSFQMPPVNFSPHFKLWNQLKIHLEYLKQLSQNPKWPISDSSSKARLSWSPSISTPACYVTGPFSLSFHFLVKAAKMF